MRFFGGDDGDRRLVEAFERSPASRIDDDPDSDGSALAEHHQPPDRLGHARLPRLSQRDKADLFLLVEPGWEPFFTDADADIDWRSLSWGGVLIDDRELGDPDGCPRRVHPGARRSAVTDRTAGGDWYPDDAIVFGIVEGDEALAIPKNIAEIHEMFNLTLGEPPLRYPVLHAVRLGPGVPHRRRRHARGADEAAGAADLGLADHGRTR